MKFSEKERSYIAIERYLKIFLLRDRFITAIYNNDETYEGVKFHGQVIKRGEKILLRYKAAKNINRKKFGNKKRKTYMKEEKQDFPLDESAKDLVGKSVVGVISIYKGKSNVKLMPMPECIYVNPKSKRSEKLMEEIQITACLETMGFNTFKGVREFIKESEESFKRWEKERREKNRLQRNDKNNK